MLFRLRSLLLPAALALAVLLAAWFFPLPSLATSPDQFAPERIPGTRSVVEKNEAAFKSAQDKYRAYIRTHDLGALLEQSRSAVKRAETSVGDTNALVAVRDTSASVIDYATILRSYAASGEAYFSALQRYDDDLMGWTRSLLAGSEAFRDDTWPIVEYLKLYPPPTGLHADTPRFSSGELQKRIDSLAARIASLDPSPNPHSGSGGTGALLSGVSADVSAIWDAGRSIEYENSLHGDYRAHLADYDRKLTNQARSSGVGPSGNRKAAAVAGNVLVGLVVFAGLTALFRSRQSPAL